MNPPETNDPIDKLLREQEAHVADNGFTQGVLKQLPRRRSSWPRIVLLVLTAAGALSAILLLPWSTLPSLDFTKAASLSSDASAWLPFAAVIVALASTAFAALRQED